MKHAQSLGFRLIMIFAAVSVPLLLALIGVSNYAKNIVLSQVSASYQNLVDTNIQMLDKSLEDTGTNMYYITTRNENFLKLGRGSLSDSEFYFTQIGLMDLNRAYQAYFRSVDMFFVYSVQDDLFITTEIQNVSALYKERVSTDLPHLLKRESLLKDYLYHWKLIDIDGQPYLLRLSGDERENKLYLGALIHVDSLKRPLQSMNLGESGEVLFLSREGRVLSGTDDGNRLVHELPSEGLLESKPFTVSSGEEKLLVINRHSQTSELSLAVVLPEYELLRGLQYFRTAVNFLPIVVVFLLLLCMLLIRRLLLLPIQQLLSVIRRIKQGDMSSRLPDTKSADFSIIHQSFNSMVEEITHLKIDVYEERLRAQRAELKHLQSQINPHFFLNTMNVIFQLADMKHNDLVKKTVRHLVQYFRFSMTAHSDTITIGHELSHIRNYLEIQKMRFQDTFEFEIHLPEEQKDIPIPSLMIQPLVENAMIHGYSVQENEPFQLQVRVWRNEGQGGAQLCVEVKDNGRGFQAEQLESLQSDDYAPEQEDRHIGIWNVKSRLRMRYGSAHSGILFENVEPHGARVEITMPVHMEGKG
ncbi:sensor histidine kinase [Paenibacillus sp. KR2-11]